MDGMFVLCPVISPVAEATLKIMWFPVDPQDGKIFCQVCFFPTPSPNISVSFQPVFSQFSDLSLISDSSSIYLHTHVDLALMVGFQTF